MERDLAQGLAAPRREEAQPLLERAVAPAAKLLEAGLHAPVHAQVHQRPVVEARPLEVAVLEAEPEGLDEGEPGARRRREAARTARVVRDLGENPLPGGLRATSGTQGAGVLRVRCAPCA